jgi:hypothetical protein
VLGGDRSDEAERHPKSAECLGGVRLPKPRRAKGKTLRGSVSLTARGTRFAKAVLAKLG